MTANSKVTINLSITQKLNKNFDIVVDFTVGHTLKVFSLVNLLIYSRHARNTHIINNSGSRHTIQMYTYKKQTKTDNL